ncbi:MAG: hypothetical protein FWD57_14580 [Polyangiaceae bacterium]|nr:hypothetical protein [Polyangiaceae bacterium]
MTEVGTPSDMPDDRNETCGESGHEPSEPAVRNRVGDTIPCTGLESEPPSAGAIPPSSLLGRVVALRPLPEFRQSAHTPAEDPPTS